MKWIAVEDARFVKQVLIEDQFFSSCLAFGRGKAQGRNKVIPVELDGVEHAGFRRALLPLFSDQRVSGIRPLMAHWIDSFLPPVTSGDNADLVPSLLVPLPSFAVASWLGFEEAPAREFSVAMNNAHGRPHANVGFDPHADVARQMLRELIGERSQRPANDLISKLLKLKISGRAVAESEVFNISTALFGAAGDTMSGLLGRAIVHLSVSEVDYNLWRSRCLTRDEQRGWVNECLRMYSRVTVRRLALRDSMIGGSKISADDVVLLDLPRANRDASLFQFPSQFDRHRPGNTHFALGLGRHRCLGAAFVLEFFSAFLESWCTGPSRYFFESPSDILATRSIELSSLRYC